MKRNDEVVYRGITNPRHTYAGDPSRKYFIDNPPHPQNDYETLIVHTALGCAIRIPGDVQTAFTEVALAASTLPPEQRIRAVANGAKAALDISLWDWRTNPEGPLFQRVGQDVILA